MFWDKGYTPSQNIEALLEKENATVEEFLDDDDILQECKSQKKSIVNYFTRPDVIKRLVEFTITEPSEELPLAQRFRYANMACEILTLGLPSLDEKLLSDIDTLKTLYSYLEREPPLNPLLSSFFSKTFSMLFTKKAEQDWFLYQQMCLKLLEYIKSQDNFLDMICKHFSTPVIPDLIMQMMKDIQGGQLKRNLYEWLTKDKLVERLIAILRNPQDTEKHVNVSEFLCDLIQQGRSMRQTEEENDSFEPAFNGSNPLLKSIESESTIEALLNVVLEPNAQESAIVSGISVVLNLIKPVTFVDEANSDRLKFIHNREKEIHEQIVTTVIYAMTPRLKEFHELLTNPPNKPDIVTPAAILSPPFGMIRLQICRLFTVLLHTNNEAVLQAICQTDFFVTLLALFKQYCWNNFLHSEVEKCLHLIFQTISISNTSTQGSTIANDGSLCKGTNNDDIASSFFEQIFKSVSNGYSTEDGDNDVLGVCRDLKDTTEYRTDNDGNNGIGGNDDNASTETNDNRNQNVDIDKHNHPNVEHTDEFDNRCEPELQKTNYEEQNKENWDCSMTPNVTYIADHYNSEEGTVEEDSGETAKDLPGQCESNDSETIKQPSFLQTHVIVNCKLISKLLDCWQYNKDLECSEKGRRLGYMGHLIKILKHISKCISEYEHIGALIESSLSDAHELKLWQSIIDPLDGDFSKALAKQNKMLANCNAHETSDYTQHLPKDFLGGTNTLDYVSANVITNLGGFNDSAFCRHADDDDDYYEGNTGILDLSGGVGNPWDLVDLEKDRNSVSWAAIFDDLEKTYSNSTNFADFNAHFNSFTSDLGDSLSASTKENNEQQKIVNTEFENAFRVENEAYDNNANVEKLAVDIFTLEDDKDDDNTKNEKVAPSVVQTLRSVLQDSEDDFGDDDGMWIKHFDKPSDESTEIKATPSQLPLVNKSGKENTNNDNWSNLNTLLNVSTRAPLHNDSIVVENEDVSINDPSAMQEHSSSNLEVLTVGVLDENTEK